MAERPSAASRLGRLLRDAFDSTIDARRYRLFQGAMGWTLLAYTAFWARDYREWLTPEGFHPSTAASVSQSPALPLVSPGIAMVLGLVFFAALAAFLFGWQRRITAGIVWLGCVYTLLVDPISSFTINRLYVICFGLFVLAPEPQGRAPGADETGSDSPAKEWQLAWPTTLGMTLVLVHYFAAGMCKVFHGSWAAHTDVLWVQIQGVYRTDIAAFLVRNVSQGAFAGLQHSALGFELLAPLLLGVRRLRPVGIVVGVGMHIVIALTMQHLIFFSAQMVAFYVLFLPLPWLDALETLLGTTKVSTKKTAPQSGAVS